MTERLTAFRRTKLYDLFAATPLIAWYCFAPCNAAIAGATVALVKLFIQTDSSVLSASLFLWIVSQVGTLAFLAFLVVMFAIRHVPERTVPGFYPRFAAVAGTFLSVGFVLLPAQELSSALYLASLILMVSGTLFSICAALVLGRSISILPEARQLVPGGLMPSSAIHFILARSLPSPELHCSTCRHGRCCCWPW